MLALIITPLFGHYLFHSQQYEAGQDPYAFPLYRMYRQRLINVLQRPGRTVLALLVVLVLCMVGFTQVRHEFFPSSNTPLFYVNYSLRQGADIIETERHAQRLDAYLRSLEEVDSVVTFIGRGATRFMLTYEPALPNAAYLQAIVRVHQRERIPALIGRLREDLKQVMPGGEIHLEELRFGPAAGARIQARFMGQDAAVLRQLADAAMAQMAESGLVRDIRTNWRQHELVIVPGYNEERARIAAIGRSDLAAASRFASSGLRAGTYRERDQQIPIITRPPIEERASLRRLSDRLIWSQAEQAYVPISQVIDGFDMVAEEAMIHRRNRVRTLSVEAEPAGNLTADQALRRMRKTIEAIDLPSGYQLQWGGEYESAREAQQALATKLPATFIMMLLITLLLFGAVRQTLVVWLVVPMAICGVTLGLLVTSLPFTFVALLGFLSLSGMLMKNAIVLVDEIDSQSRDGKPRTEALIDASVSRLRPVILASITTILGMVPLLWDAFFASMAVTIMAGLAFATVLTLIAVPVLYALFFHIRY